MGRMTRMQGAPERPLDTTPIEVPLRACRPEPLDAVIARMVRQSIAAESESSYETWEESDDFEEEEPETLDFSRYELQELQSESAIRDYGPEPDSDFAAESVGHSPSQAASADTGDQPDPDAVEPDKP